MDVSSASDGTFERGDEGRFSGEVWLRGTISAEDGTSVAVVHFSPGARTHWHRHAGGQFLFAVSGRGRVRTRGEPGHTLEPGDVVHANADEWHFHGGGPDSPLVHVSINGGGAIDWGDPVDEDDYAEGF